MAIAAFDFDNSEMYQSIINKDGYYDIVEIYSGNCLYKNLSSGQVAPTLAWLNSARPGFNGWTPSFCLKQNRKINNI